jgi:dipeptidyl aminopeptidase/acylaminoacyl peptidase
MKVFKFHKYFISCLTVLLLAALPIAGQNSDDDGNRSRPITSWLINGPYEMALPVFHESRNLQGKTFNMESLLEFKAFDYSHWHPQQGDILIWDRSYHLPWQWMQNGGEDIVLPVMRGSHSPEITYLICYIENTRFAEAELRVASHHLFQVYLDGQKLITKKKTDKPDEENQTVEPGEKIKKLMLETGKHLLMIKALRDPDNLLIWKVRASLSYPDDWQENEITINTSPGQSMDISHLMDGPKVVDAAISPDGKLAAVSLRRSQPSDNEESWLELREVRNGRLVQTFRGGMKISHIQWSPKGTRFSYTTSAEETSTLWVVDLEKGTNTPLLNRIMDLESHAWSPDGTFVIYSITEKPKEDKTGLRKLEGMPDRWPWWRNRSFLYRISFPRGVRTRLTSGRLSTTLNSISPNGKRLLFTRTVTDFSERPYDKAEFFVLDLETMQLDSLWTTRWAGSAQWSPDGKKLLVTGGPSAFGGIGQNVPVGLIPNEYDQQVFLYDFETRTMDPITYEFHPSVSQAIWSKQEKCIYLICTDNSYRRLFRYDLKKKNFESMDTGVDVLDRLDIADEKQVAVYTASGVSDPPRVYILDLRRNKNRLLTDPAEEQYRHVRFGRCEDWDFENQQSILIHGRIYFPPDFDPDKKYPCIVYYYGGTSPVSRDFGGRYPKELYAANGYIVYVLQPSGATGFGQAFSALHVNNWGMTVADEIIDGVQKFLASHPYVDARRVGCIGASYGGFMTMLLTTRTDIFAAAVSHAGISSISSYWGEGYWGYLYSAAATADSYPWNRRDIYVDQSPLFHADKVVTPLLLLHGASDTNVPPGESYQFYTALKLLGKEVELVEVAGQDHHIMQYDKRIRWTKTILAWFDRWLKGQPGWWEYLYPQQ